MPVLFPVLNFNCHVHCDIFIYKFPLSFYKIYISCIYSFVSTSYKQFLFTENRNLLRGRYENIYLNWLNKHVHFVRVKFDGVFISEKGE